MNQKYRTALMWALYSLLFLLVLLLQTSLFGRLRLWGVKVSLLPMTLCCIALFTGHEPGCVFALAASLFWQLSGAEDGPLAILTFTLIALFAGWLCDAVFPRRFLPALVLCACALLFHEGCIFLLKFYLGNASLEMGLWVLKTTALSLPLCPLLYLLAKAIGKVGGPA